LTKKKVYFAIDRVMFRLIVMSIVPAHL